MCEYTFRALGKEPPVDGWEGPEHNTYRHLWVEAGLIVRTHRTYRSSPVGWVFQVLGEGECSLIVGYAKTQRAALQEAAHWLSGRCGYKPKHRAEGFHPEAWEPTEYIGAHRADKQLPGWAA